MTVDFPQRLDVLAFICKFPSGLTVSVDPKKSADFRWRRTTLIAQTDAAKRWLQMNLPANATILEA